MPEIVTSPGLLGLTAVLAYLLGSIPFGLVITRAMGLGDLRKIGSGNIGATNVLRTGSKAAALATLILDAGKGGVAVLIAGWLIGGDAAQLAALASFLGHLFPVWLGFRGGKGVATCLGILLAISWPVGLSVCATWLVAAVLSRISSLSALIASASTVLWLPLFGRSDLMALALALTALIFIRHAANIRRILAGTETKIGQRRA